MKNKERTMDYIKASRRGSREAEIAMFGKPAGGTKVHKSKKIYDRKKMKTALRSRSFFIRYAFAPDIITAILAP